jgi:hypothetical protein
MKNSTTEVVFRNKVDQKYEIKNDIMRKTTLTLGTRKINTEKAAIPAKE